MLAWRRNVTCLAIVLAAPLVGAADAPGDPPHKTVAPVVIDEPGEAAFARYAPDLNAGTREGGSATLHCTVTVSGVLSDCTVKSEQPQGSGFGAAALKLAPLYRLSPELVDGTAVAAPISLVVPFAPPTELRPPETEVAVDHPWQPCPPDAPKADRYYPPRAQNQGRTGSADIECRVRSDGSMASCTWISENPPGYEFGDYAARITCLLRSTSPRPGWIFKHTVRFNLGG
jgi:hypothetical protein